jgi:hypothetical protein
MRTTLPKLIALAGHKGSGKDTAALHLMAKYGYRPISLAYILKDKVADMYNIPRDWMDDRRLKEEPLLNYPAIPTDSFSATIHSLLKDELKSGYWTPRALLILEGSVKRSVRANWWIERVLDTIRSSSSGYIITDMRYCNEANTLKLLVPGTKCIRIHRDSVKLATQDPSERDLDYYPFDAVIQNNGTIDELNRMIDIHLGGL